MTTEAIEMRVKLTRFMKRLLNTALIGAWDRWKDFAKESAGPYTTPLFSPT